MKCIFWTIVVFVFFMVNANEIPDLSLFGGPSHGKPRVEWYTTQLDYTMKNNNS